MGKIAVAFLILTSVACAQTRTLSLSEINRGRNDGVGLTSGLYPESASALLGGNDFSLLMPTETKQSARKLTGVLSRDLFSTQPESLTHKDSLAMFESRSSLKSGFFSLLIPGAGQLYNGGTGNYLKAAGFLAIEAAAIAVNIMWTNKGNNQTNFFQNYADANYSVVRYVQWIQLNLPTLENQPGVTSDVSTANLYASNNEIWVNHKGPDPTQPSWTQVDWGALNRVESALGGFFSHNLPEHGQQQYYELIGKYPEFREGWNPNAATDNVNTTYDQIKNDVQVAQDNYYMDQRGKANSLYAVAGTAIGVVIANHFVSAIEAAVWAHGHNKLIETSFGVSPVPMPGAGYQTRVNVAVNF